MFTFRGPEVWLISHAVKDITITAEAHCMKRVTSCRGRAIVCVNLILTVNWVSG